jgi:hypothetical protein
MLAAKAKAETPWTLSPAAAAASAAAASSSMAAAAAAAAAASRDAGASRQRLCFRCLVAYLHLACRYGDEARSLALRLVCVDVGFGGRWRGCWLRSASLAVSDRFLRWTCCFFAGWLSGRCGLWCWRGRRSWSK